LSKVFAREATGLVRSFTFLDQFLMSQGIVIVLNGFVSAALMALFYFPGADLPTVFGIGCIPAFAMAYIYGKFSAGMPRSGGDYVWSTRIMGALYGSVQFVFLFLLTIVFITICDWYESTTVLSQMVVALGINYHNAGMISTGISLGQVSLGFPVSMLILIVTIAIALLGLKTFSAFQRVIIPLYYLCTAVFLVTILTIDPSSFAGTFDRAMQVAGYNLTYAGIAGQAGSITGVNWSNTMLAAIPWGFQTFTNFNFPSYLAGETKNAKSAITRAFLLSVATAAILLMVMSFACYRDFGSAFIYGVSYLGATNPSALPVVPTLSFLSSLTNPVSALLTGLGLFLGLFIGIISLLVSVSRMIFAASFDRLVPTAFAKVDERFHSPYLAIALMAGVSLVLQPIFWFTNFFSTFLNTGLILPIAYMMPLIAALLFVFKKPELFKNTVGQVSSKRAVVTASAVGVVSFAIYFVALTFPILSGVFLGASLVYAYSVVIAGIVVGSMVYATARIRAKRAGVDMAWVYSQVPPE
jgi:APA family basic amino acid/polyamine antiporter